MSDAKERDAIGIPIFNLAHNFTDVSKENCVKHFAFDGITERKRIQQNKKLLFLC